MKFCISTIKAVMKNEVLSSTDKLVFICLCLYDNGNGSCFPSQSKIAKDLSITRASVNKSIRKLKAEKLLEYHTGNDGKTINYVLNHLYRGCKAEFTGGVKQALQGGVKQTLHKIISINNKLNNKINNDIFSLDSYQEISFLKIAGCEDETI